MDKLEYDVVTTEIVAAQKLANKSSDDGPKPFIKGFSFTG